MEGTKPELEVLSDFSITISKEFRGYFPESV
jgi:hypothetical protein